MDHNLFERIFAIVFEPVASVAMLGVLLALAINAGKRGRLFWLLAGVLTVAVVWRSCIDLISNRYAEIFLFAGFGFASYFIFKLPGWLGCVLKSLSWRGASGFAAFLTRHSLAISRILLLCLVASCIGKLTRYNRYDYGFAESAKTVRRDAAIHGPAELHSFAGDGPRLRYYSGLPVVTHEIEGTTPSAMELRAVLKNRELTIYVVCDQPPDAILSHEEADVAPEDWERIYSFPRDNRKKLYLNVYRCKRAATEEVGR